MSQGVQQYLDDPGRIQMEISVNGAALYDCDKLLSKWSRSAVVKVEGRTLTLKSRGKEQISGASIEGMIDLVTVSDDDTLMIKAAEGGTYGWKRIK